MFTTFSIPIPTEVITSIFVLTLIAIGLAVYSIRSLKQAQRQRELSNYNEWLRPYCENRNNFN